MIGSARLETQDATARYVAAALPPFEAMRAAATQLAGHLLQRVVDPECRLGQAPGLALIEDMLGQAGDLLLAIEPRGPVAVHHHRHLTAALHSLRAACLAAAENSTSLHHPGLADACERPLNEAIAQLRHAAGSLPGFALVDLADCCGAALTPRSQVPG